MRLEIQRLIHKTILKSQVRCPDKVVPQNGSLQGLNKKKTQFACDGDL